MAKVVFCDFSTPKPYDKSSLNGPLGGTEATVIRVASELSKTNDVYVLQHNRAFSHSIYHPMTIMEDIKKPDLVVALRNTTLAPFLRKVFPYSPIAVWLHDLPTNQLAIDAMMLKDIEAALVCVSDIHKLECVEMLKVGGDITGLRIERIYNPVEDNLKPNNLEPSPNSLFFASSPHKGLQDTINTFVRLRVQYPKLELSIANPGYYKSIVDVPAGVRILGELGHDDVIRRMREAFAVLYLNEVFPETFGLVFAEANAVGTPVITHNIGAASEVLHPAAEQMVAGHNVKAVYDKLSSWYKYGRPKVSLKEEFKLSSVVAAWKRLFKLN